MVRSGRSGRELDEVAWANLWGRVGVIFLRLVELIEMRSQCVLQ